MYNFQAQATVGGLLNPFKCLCKDTSKIPRHKQIHSKTLGGGGWSQKHQN